MPLTNQRQQREYDQLITDMMAKIKNELLRHPWELEVNDQASQNGHIVFTVANLSGSQTLSIALSPHISHYNAEMDYSRDTLCLSARISNNNGPFLSMEFTTKADQGRMAFYSPLSLADNFLFWLNGFLKSEWKKNVQVSLG